MREFRKIVAQALLVAALGAAAGLAVNSPHVVKFFRGEYREAFADLKTFEELIFIGRPEAEDLFAVGEAVFIDARSPEEFEAGHIFGAKNVPVYDPNVDLIWESLAVPQDVTIVVYCSGGFCQDSLMLARWLIDRGWRSVRIFSGGWEEWSRAGLPTEAGR